MAAILLIEDKNQWQNLFTKIIKKGKVTKEVPTEELAWEETVRQILKELIREIKGPGIYEHIIHKVEKLLIAIVLEEGRRERKSDESCLPFRNKQKHAAPKNKIVDHCFQGGCSIKE